MPAGHRRHPWKSGGMATSHSSPTVSPFRIEIPEESLADLRSRLRSARFPQPLPGDDWDTGVPVAYLRRLVEAWEGFDWRAFEARLNRLPHHTTDIDGQTIHFVHVRSAVPGALPLLLTHGWPGSFLEFVDLIGPLTDPEAHGGTAADAFDVVIPSLPGFVFSTPLHGTGWTFTRIASAWITLMDRLGYRRFAVQGGDLGAAIAPQVGRLAADRVIGVHVNGALGDFAGEMDEEALASLTPLEQDRMRRIGEFMRSGFGYIAVQSTRPGLIGVMAADSPVAQLAWIVDKLRAWTHPLDALPEEVLGWDFVLGNASLYWFTACAGAAAYVGYAQREEPEATSRNSGVPTGAVQFAHDIGIRRFAERSNTIVRWTDVEGRGGHFAALEEPELFLDDLQAFFRPLRGVHSA
ncbi:epoxide hydrolase [Thermobifida alba]